MSPWLCSVPSVPHDLAVSARIDGAGDFRISRTISLPLSPAGIATITLFELVSRRNQFLAVVFHINDSKKCTLQVTLNVMGTENLVPSGMSLVTPNVRVAGIVILLLVIHYPFMQQYCVHGLTVGSGKE